MGTDDARALRARIAELEYQVEHLEDRLRKQPEALLGLLADAQTEAEAALAAVDSCEGES